MVFNSLARWTLIEKYGDHHGKICKEKGEGMVRERSQATVQTTASLSPGTKIPRCWKRDFVHKIYIAIRVHADKPSLAWAKSTLGTNPAAGTSEMCCGLCLQMSAGTSKKHLCLQGRAGWEGVLGRAIDPTSQPPLRWGRRSFLHETTSSSAKAVVGKKV